MRQLFEASPLADLVDLEQPLLRRLIYRCGWTLVWIGVLTTGLGVWGWWSTWPPDALFSPLITMAAVVGLTAVWTLTIPEKQWFTRVSLATAMLTTLYFQGLQIRGRGYYSTDSAAFNDVATNLFVHGHNPYSWSVGQGAVQLIENPARFWTYTLNGSHVSQVSYPAGSFLLQAPLQLLGVHHLPSDWMDLLCGVAAMLLLYKMLPQIVRWLAPVLLLGGFYIGIFSNGGTDALFLPFLLLAVWRWDRFVDPTASRLTRFASPVALGVACSIKQTPWFCALFLIVGIAIEARDHARPVATTTASYAGVVAGVFALINLPFFLGNPRGWLHGAFLPLIDPLVPDGQGVISFALHGSFHGARLAWLTVAGALAVLAVLALFVLRYTTFKRSWLFLLPLALLLPARSLSEYALDFVPVAIVAAFSVESTEAVVWPRLGARLRRGVLAAPVLAIVVCLALAFSRPVLTITVGNVTTSEGTSLYATMVVRLTNNTGSTVTPSVMVLENDTHPTGFWHLAEGGSLVLGPHQSKIVTLVSPATTPTSLRDQYWIVTAVTPSPASISSSSPIQWHLGHR